MPGSLQIPMSRGNNVFLFLLLSQVCSLFLLTEHTVTVKEQGRCLKCVFWKAGGVCSPLWGGVDEICHVYFQKHLSETFPSPAYGPTERRSSLLGKNSFPPPPVLSAGSRGVACARACEERSGVLSGEMPQATLGHPALTSGLCQLRHFPSLAKDPKDGLPLGATGAHQSV